ncbi:MAG: SAM-dependent chlorinase/fluorinase [Edaphocola sp.]
MIVTLLSDFGNSDNFVGVVKGILLQYVPTLNIIDLNHAVEPYNLLQCSYQLVGSYLNFPENSIHVCLFDLMYARSAALLLLRTQNRYIIAADNGILPITFGHEVAVWHYAQNATGYNEWFHLAGKLIHDITRPGFDIQKLNLAKPGVVPHPIKPIESGNAVECHVIHIDRYENVILNLTRTDFEAMRQGRKFRIPLVKESITVINDDYEDVGKGYALCRFNQAGFMEIAINQGKAASLLGLKLHTGAQLFYKSIKIEFE